MKTTLLTVVAVLGFVFYGLTSFGQQNTDVYTTVKGDSVALICKKFQISMGELLAENPGLNPTRLEVGQEVKIPVKSNAASSDDSTAWPDTGSPEFKSAVNYGIAQALYSAFEANCWSPLCGEEPFQLTQSVHGKLGQSVTMNVFGRKGDDGSAEIYVFFPDFTLRKTELYLRFSRTEQGYLFLEQGFGEEFLRYDFVKKGLETLLPKDYTAVVKTEFQPKPSDIVRLRQWCQEILREEHPSAVKKTNHFFVAPYSSRYDSYQASIYWAEGKKIIRVEQVTNPTNQRLALNDLGDYSQPIQGEKASDYAGAYEWRNFVISRHVVDGLMVTVDALK
jgi:LysM repeat protein